MVFNLSSAGASFYTISSTEWSTTPNGAPISGAPYSVSGGTANITDSLYIGHDLTINKMSLGANAYIKVLDGATLTLTGNGFGSRIDLYGYLDVDQGGALLVNASNFTVNGTLNVNGSALINSTTAFNDSLFGEGTITVTNNPITLNSAAVNGSIVSGTWSDTTIFVGSYNTSWSNVVWYYNGVFSSQVTDCSTELRIMSDYTNSTPRTVGKLVVKGNVNFTIDNSVTLQVCSDITNEGFIFVRTGSTLQVQGN